MARILDSIKSPAQLRSLAPVELEQLAAEIRQEIITTVSRNGGHLAPNLGTIELTLALHIAFDTPRDLLVWDIGHQAYAHKLVTGRVDRFGTIKQFGGLSGYLRRDESPYDAFGASHASTSISAALGMAVGRDIEHQDFHVVAIIGDGALTGGMALEAINNAGADEEQVSSSCSTTTIRASLTMSARCINISASFAPIRVSASCATPPSISSKICRSSAISAPKSRGAPCAA